MDEFIWVLLTGLLFIGVLLVIWGIPEQGPGVNVTNGVTKIENPFSIGLFPKDVPRQIVLGDFKVSYAVGSDVLETKRDVEITSKKSFSMSKEIELDLSMVTGGFLTIYVSGTNQEGNLVIKVNGNEVFNQRVTAGKIEVPIDKGVLKDYNIVEMSCPRSGWKFWSSPFYKLDKVEFGVNFYGNLEKTEEFQVYPEELRNFRSGEVSFKLKDYSGQGDLLIGVNNHRIYKGQPSLNFYQSFDQYQVGLTSGVNSISFTAESGASYEIEDAVLTVIRQESAAKSRSFEFSVDSSWNDKLEGSISFYISDTDYKGNLLVTITDAAGNKHPSEAIQSYSIGEIKTISFDKDYVDYGTNTVAFEATDGSFVISNVEIKPK